MVPPGPVDRSAVGGGLARRGGARRAMLHLRANGGDFSLVDEAVLVGIQPGEALVGAGAHLVLADAAVLVRIDLGEANTVMAPAHRVLAIRPAAAVGAHPPRRAG